MAEQEIAVVTGGNRGIGLEVCRQLAKLGIRVILGSRDGAKGIAAAKELSATGLPVEAHQLDVASAKSIGECMNWVRRDVGRIDILVNNAGIMVEEGDADPLEELEIIRETMQTNVYGPVLLSRLAIPHYEEPALWPHRQSLEQHGVARRNGRRIHWLQDVEGRDQRRDQSYRCRNRGNGDSRKLG